VAGGLGLCGLDPRRPALTGTEMRPCWTATPPGDHGERVLVAVGPGRRQARDQSDAPGTGRTPRTFVPVEAQVGPAGDAPEGSAGTRDGALATASNIAPAPGTPGLSPGTWWLWGDPEPWPDY
jgi:hypothetical protein